MATKTQKRNLGIGQAVQEVKEVLENKVTPINDLKGMKVVQLDLNILVDYPDNDEIFGDLEGRDFEELCESISQRGILQPIIVRPMGDQYEILAGHQRKRAAKAIGEIKIPAIIKDVDAVEARLIWLDTNIRGRHLSPKQLGRALDEAYKMLEAKRNSGQLNYKGKTSQLIAEKYDMSPRSVEELLMITRKVAETIQDLGLNKASMKQMSKLTKDQQEALLLLLGEETIKNLTASEIEKAVETMKNEMENLDNTYKKQLEEKEEILKEKEKNINRLNNAFNTIRTELGDLTNKHSNIEREIEEEREKRLKLQEKLESADIKEKEKLIEEIKAKDEEIDKMLMESIKMTENISELKKTMEELQEEKNLLEEHVNNLEEDYQSLYKESRKYLAENESLKEKLKQINEVNQKNYEAIKHELEELRKKDNIEVSLNKALEDLGHAFTIVSNLEKLQDTKHVEMKDKLNSMLDNIKEKLKQI